MVDEGRMLIVERRRQRRRRRPNLQNDRIEIVTSQRGTRRARRERVTLWHCDGSSHVGLELSVSFFWHTPSQSCLCSLVYSQLWLLRRPCSEFGSGFFLLLGCSCLNEFRLEISQSVDLKFSLAPENRSRIQPARPLVLHPARACTGKAITNENIINFQRIRECLVRMKLDWP